MQKITFKVAYLHWGTQSRVLDLVKIDKIGNTTFIDKAGSVHERPLGASETPHRIVLSRVEMLTDSQGKERKRVYAELSYYTEESSGQVFKTLSDIEKAEHLVNKNAHELLKSHQCVAFRDETGNDINPNRIGFQVNFELIEESQQILNKLNKNMLIQDAWEIAKDAYTNNQTDFIDLCYAYGIRPIEGVEIEKLYNEVTLKISINPQHFLDVYSDKNREMKVAIAKAIQLEDESRNPLIKIDNDMYYMAGDILGSDVDAVVHYFNTHPKAKEYLFAKLGIKKEIEVAVTNLPPVQEKIELTPQAKIYKTRVDNGRLEEMERSVKVEIRKFKDSIKKGTKKEDAMLSLEESLGKKRGNFADVVEVFDEFVEKEKSFL